MARRHEALHALNAGGVDPEAVARIDLQKLQIAGEHPVENFLPRVLGPMTLRPGSEMLATIPGNAQTRMLRFWKEDGAGYILLLSPGEMRVVYNGAIQQVPAVTTAIDTASWTDESDVGATATGGSTLTLTATSTATARLRQSRNLGANAQIVHVLKVVVSAGPVFLRVGSTAGGEEILADAELDTGTHKIAFDPDGATPIYIEVSSTDPVIRSVSSIDFEPAGDLVIPTPWANITRIQKLRTWQSLDVIFAGDGTGQPQRIEHRGPLSWSVVGYKSRNGPWIAGSDRISMTPAAVSGNTTLTASAPFFKSGHVGALIEVTHAGRTITQTMNVLDETTDYVTVIGVTTGRYFYVTATASAFVGTLVLERSFEPSDPSTWSTYASWVDGAANFARTLQNDGQDNVTVHYRFRVSAYTSGSTAVILEYDSDIQVALARITARTSTTEVDVEVLTDFGRAVASKNWRISAWSGVEGWPRTPVIQDGRLHWFKGDQDFASVPDDYTNFDDREIGDGAPFTRSVGLGGESEVLWAASLDRLLTGSPRAEMVISASEFDGPLTPTNYTVRRPSKRGSADVDAAEHDDGLFFVQRSGKRLYEFSSVQRGNRFEATDVSRLNPAAYKPGVVRLAVQQQPDTRAYAVLEDGNVSVLTWDRRDEVAAITTLNIQGAFVDDIVTLPNTDQDDVYLLTRRGGIRYLERLAKEADQADPDTCALLDGFKVLDGTVDAEGAVSAISGGGHFANQSVSVWADGAYLGNFTLDASGSVSLGGTFSRVVYGKSYDAIFQSVKLGYAAQLGTALSQTKKVHGVSMLLVNSTLDGIEVGPDVDHLDELEAYHEGAVRTASQFVEHYDQEILPINGEWETDARFYIRVRSRYGPKTIQGVVLDIETRDGAGGNG